MMKAVLITLAMATSATAQNNKELRSAISYISGSTLYLNAGRLLNVSPGDSVKIFRDGRGIGSAVITAIADSSSAAGILAAEEELRIGDSVIIAVSAPPQSEKKTILPAHSGESVLSGATTQAEGTQKSNLTSGRIALQYDMISAEDSKLNLNQPAALLQLRVSNLFGIGMTLNVYGTSFWDPNGEYALYGNKSGILNNLYTASLSGQINAAGIGFGLGRMNSEYVTGLGTFDGGQVYVNLGNFTLGGIGGAASSIPSSQLSFTGTKSAGFVNYRTGSDIFHQYSGTLAYGVRLLNGNLDRNFLYLQNSLTLGSNLNFYESSEIDMSKLAGGNRVGGFDFSNTFLSVNYFPASWLFANFGYDAYRNVYLFQTMKSIPDSLIDRNIFQGFRGGVTAYLPTGISLTLDGSFGTRRDYARNEHSFGGSVRASDILDLGIGGSVRYTNLYGVYSNGGDFILELDRNFFDALDVSLSYDYYDISVSLLQQTYTTQTLSGMLEYDFSSRWYSSLDLDDVIDATMNSIRVYAEIGFRF